MYVFLYAIAIGIHMKPILYGLNKFAKTVK